MNLLHYRERLGGLTYSDALDEPLDVIHFALTSWSLEHYRDKLEAARQQSSS